MELTNGGTRRSAMIALMTEEQDPRETPYCDGSSVSLLSVSGRIFNV